MVYAYYFYIAMAALGSAILADKLTENSNTNWWITYIGVAFTIQGILYFLYRIAESLHLISLSLG